MKILLTGLTGFIGGHLARSFCSSGAEVVGLVRKPVEAGQLATGVRTALHDGTTQGLARIVSDVRPDVTLHLASLFVAEHRPEQVEELVASNVLFGTQLADALTSVGCGRLINTGTSWQHYEDRSYDPVCLYAATKQAFESILEYYVNARALKLVTLKLFDTYGPGDKRRKLFTLLREHGDSGQPLSMSEGNQLVDLVFIDDVIAAYEIAVKRVLLMPDSGTSETYGVSSGQPIPLRQLVARYASITRKRLDVRWGERPYRAREVMTPWAGAPRLPGWQARVPLEQGIIRMEECPPHV